MKKIVALIGATAAGFTSMLALYGPSSHGGPLVRATPPSSRSGATSPPTTTPVSAPTTTTTTGAPASSSTYRVSAVGRLENYGYGTMSVQVTVASNHIVGLKVASLQTIDSYSQQLAQQVVPMLKGEVLAAQGTRIQAISGATYTSEAYAFSIQSALDRLHIK